MLAGGMGETLHWHPENVALSALATTLVGMANASGGTVLLGIAPRTGEIIGVRETEGMIDRIFQATLLADPPLVLPVPRLCDYGGAQLFIITVPAGLPHVYALDGRYLGREGSRTQPLAARKLRQMLLERGVVQFESQEPPDATLNDLNMGIVQAYVDGLNLSSELTPEEILLRRGCLKRSGNDIRPTYAALLLFGAHPQEWLPNATILSARFSGATFADRFIKEDITGRLPDQLRQAERFVKDNLRRVVRLEGLSHQETSEYPLEAVRELLVNAVAHRDYNLQGDNIHLNIFADRIEVQSPGGLPGPVTLENLLEARFSRNAIIVQILSDMGFVERLGYGLDRVVRVMHQNGLPPPKFEEKAGTFCVTLYSETTKNSVPLDYSIPNHLDLNPRQHNALLYLVQHKRITNRDYQELCPEVHPETLRRDLADMVSKGALIKIGDKKATYYILK